MAEENNESADELKENLAKRQNIDVDKATLAQKLDKDLAEYISQLKPKKYEDGWPEDKWEEEMEKHPLFMTKPVNEGEELPPLVEAMQQLKYDPDVNTPEELAKSYKDDGNHYFKVKKYRWAVESYTEGLKANCDDNELNGQLYTNRAAAHFHIGNYKKSLEDSKEAKKWIPGHLKAIRRGALCCLKLKHYADCFLWCEEGLQLHANDSELQQTRMNCEKEKIIYERDKRKADVKAAHQKKEEELLKKAIMERGINIKKETSSFNLSDLEPVVSALAESRVHFDENGSLIWPVLLLYPEYGVTDYIQAFHEDSCLADHFKEMFNDENRPSWDKENVYRAENLQPYFGDTVDGLIQVDCSQTLKSILSHKRYVLVSGTPCFFVVIPESKFEKHWLKINQKFQK